MTELVFNVTQESDGGYVAVAVGESIATQGDTWDELCYMVMDATRAYFSDSKPPDRLRLFLHVEQVLAVARRLLVKLSPIGEVCLRATCFPAGTKMSGSGQRITGKLVDGFSRLLLLIGATVFFIGGKFLDEIKHRNFLPSESIGILGGLFLMFLGWAIARPKGP